MMRTQIQLTEVQYQRLKRWASRKGISLSEAVRRCVDARLSAEEVVQDRQDLVRDAQSVIGKYSDPEGPTRVGRDHDDELDKAYRE